VYIYKVAKSSGFSFGQEKIKLNNKLCRDVIGNRKNDI